MYVHIILIVCSRDGYGFILQETCLCLPEVRTDPSNKVLYQGISSTPCFQGEVTAAVLPCAASEPGRLLFHSVDYDKEIWLYQLS